MAVSVHLLIKSACEVKNNLIQKNGVFLSEVSFLVLEILMFFYYAN